MIYRVCMNKSTLVQLLRIRGFHPTEKRAKFQQKPWCWELNWKEPAGQCKAVAEYVGGKLGVRIEHPGGHKYEVIPRGEQLRLAILRPAMPPLPQ